MLNGDSATFNVQYRLFDVDPSKNPHKLPPLMDRGAQKMLGLEDTTTTFHRELLKTLLREEPSDSNPQMAQAVLGLMRVYTDLPRDGREKEYSSVDIADQLYFAHQSASLSLGLMDNLNATTLLGSLSEDQVTKVAAAKDDTGLSDDEKAARALGPETLKRFQSGVMQEPGYYSLLIQTLADLRLGK
jgi:hypothetical protein